MSDNDPTYTKEFDPDRVVRRDGAGDSTAAELRRDPVYVYDPEIVLAVNVALATRRPILVRGASGAGKSSLARNVGHVLGWRYLERVVTSRTQARDLLYEVDMLRRLQDAQQGKLQQGYEPYVVPGVLWTAFDPTGGRAVVLIDEIDKADPDVPNNLLVPLGALGFEVQETGQQITSDEDSAPLVFLTTNEERELPPAFLRRCVELDLPTPTAGRLVEIARAHHPDLDPDWIESVAEALFGTMDEERRNQEVSVSPAEFLDTVLACHRLGIEPGDDAWQAPSRSTVWKHDRREERG